MQIRNHLGRSEWHACWEKRKECEHRIWWSRCSKPQPGRHSERSATSPRVGVSSVRHAEQGTLLVNDETGGCDIVRVIIFDVEGSCVEVDSKRAESGGNQVDGIPSGRLWGLTNILAHVVKRRKRRGETTLGRISSASEAQITISPFKLPDNIAMGGESKKRDATQVMASLVHN